MKGVIKPRIISPTPRQLASSLSEGVVALQRDLLSLLDEGIWPLWKAADLLTDRCLRPGPIAVDSEIFTAAGNVVIALQSLLADEISASHPETAFGLRISQLKELHAKMVPKCSRKPKAAAPPDPQQLRKQIDELTAASTTGSGEIQATVLTKVLSRLLKETGPDGSLHQQAEPVSADVDMLLNETGAPLSALLRDLSHCGDPRQCQRDLAEPREKPDLEISWSVRPPACEPDTLTESSWHKASSPPESEHDCGDSPYHLFKNWRGFLIHGLTLGMLVVLPLVAWHLHQSLSAVAHRDPAGARFLDESGRLTPDQQRALTTCLKGYFNADTIAEKLPFVRHPELTGRRLTQYLATHREPEIALGFAAHSAYRIDDRDFLRVIVQWNDQPRLVHLEWRPPQFLIDWESMVAYTPVDWETLQPLEARGNAFANARVLIGIGDYYNFDFQEEAHYQCFTLMDPDRKCLFYGYVERYTSLHRQIVHALKINGVKTSPVNRGMSATVELEPDENTRATRQFRIRALVTPGWLLRDDPSSESI